MSQGGGRLHGPAGSASREYLLAAVCTLIVLAIAVADWVTPAGVVVGIFLSVPIVVSSLSGKAAQVWGISLLAHGSFAIAAVLGRGPISPAAVWVPNRVFTILTLAASTALALVLQRHRLQAERARDQALHARDANRLLMSLLAHDLRTPLQLAVQGLDYVMGAPSGAPLDEELVRELRGRLSRSLHAVEVVLTAARRELHPSPGEAAAPLSSEIRDEVEAFGAEAAAADKEVQASVAPEVDAQAGAVNRLVLRQSLAIALDNAIRYAVPGRVEVRAAVEDHHLVVRVTDPGPGFTAVPAVANGGGTGMGLDLARALVQLAGGELEIERDGPAGSCLAVRLPLRPESAPEGPGLGE